MTLIRRAKRQHHLLAQFLKHWKRDLLSLREYCQVKLNRTRPTISVGDVIIVGDDNTKQSFWKLARVVELLTGQDGIAWAALINVVGHLRSWKEAPVIWFQLKLMLAVMRGQRHQPQKLDEVESTQVPEPWVVLEEMRQCWEKLSGELGLIVCSFEQLMFASQVIKQGECVRTSNFLVVGTVLIQSTHYQAIIL